MTDFDSTLMFEQWPDGVIIIDESGKIVSLNNLAKEILDYQDNELIGNDIHQCLCAPAANYQHDKEQCPFLNIKQSQDNEADEAWWIANNGNYLHLDVKTIILKQNSKSYTLLNFQYCINFFTFFINWNNTDTHTNSIFLIFPDKIIIVNILAYAFSNCLSLFNWTTIQNCAKFIAS